jgi:hypothetical protein
MPFRAHYKALSRIFLFSFLFTFFFVFFGDLFGDLFGGFFGAPPGPQQDPLGLFSTPLRSLLGPSWAHLRKTLFLSLFLSLSPFLFLLFLFLMFLPFVGAPLGPSLIPLGPSQGPPWVL